MLLRGRSKARARPSLITVIWLTAASTCRAASRAARFLLAAGGGEQFEMDALRLHALGLEAVAHGLGHFLRATDECRVEGFDVEPAAEQLLALVGVDPAVVQVDILLLAAEHEDQVQALQVAVFQVFELLAEQRAGAGAVAVQQGDAAVELGLQGGLDDRQDRRDAAARRHGQVIAMACRVEFDAEVPGGRHHFQGVSGFQLFVGKRRETSAGDTFDGNAQFTVVDPCADRIGAAYFFAVQLVRITRCWPWVKWKLSCKCCGISKAMDTASRVSARTSLMVRL